MTVIDRSRNLLAAALFFTLVLAGQAAPIAKREIREDRHGSVIARLYASFEVQSTAARRWYLDALRGRRVNTRQFRVFAVPLETATFASFTYTYTSGTERRTRVYHSRSGRNNLWQFERDLRTRARVEDYYPPTITATIALDQPPGAISAVTVSPVPGDPFPDQRKRDAELKVAQQLVRDIQQGLVDRGGTLQGFTSQEPCASCEAALTALSDAWNIPVQVTYLGRNSQAYGQFQNMRQQFVSSVHVAANGGQVNLLNEEAGPSGNAPVSHVCVDDRQLPDRHPR